MRILPQSGAPERPSALLANVRIGWKGIRTSVKNPTVTDLLMWGILNKSQAVSGLDVLGQDGVTPHAFGEDDPAFVATSPAANVHVLERLDGHGVDPLLLETLGQALM